MAEVSPGFRLAERSYFDEDFEALVAIESDAGKLHWSKNAIGEFSGRLTADIRVILANESDTPVAFYAVEHDDEDLRICNLAVHTGWRRRGIGKFALEAIEKLARELNYRRIVLEVLEENLPAQLLYQKAGFKVTEISKHHYGLYVHGIRMVKRLAPR